MVGRRRCARLLTGQLQYSHEACKFPSIRFYDIFLLDIPIAFHQIGRNKSTFHTHAWWTFEIEERLKNPHTHTDTQLHPRKACSEQLLQCRYRCNQSSRHKSDSLDLLSAVMSSVRRHCVVRQLHQLALIGHYDYIQFTSIVNARCKHERNAQYYIMLSESSECCEMRRANHWIHTINFDINSPVISLCFWECSRNSAQQIEKSLEIWDCFAENPHLREMRWKTKCFKRANERRPLCGVCHHDWMQYATFASYTQNKASKRAQPIRRKLEMGQCSILPPLSSKE